MATVAVIGAQWGDEGKGKIVDFAAERADLVVRYQGGNNAGHTVVVKDREYKLHLVPSGVFYPGKVCVIGNGVVLDPAVLARELDYLADQGVTNPDLRISPAAHVILPYHIRLDEVDEDRKGKNKIGTTRRGIGPCYMDKFARVGIRVDDLLDKDRFLDLLQRNLAEKNPLLEKVYGVAGFTLDEIAGPYLAYAERIRPFVADTVAIINEAIEAGKNVLFEGAQGTLLDIDFGTYPYVTSSHPIAGGACVGAGVGPNQIQTVIGVVKAYTSRVGDGPFPTELLNQTGEWIRERGHEYGTTTGRARRVGWLDTVIVRYAARLSGITGLAITRLDTLGGLDKVKICTGYRMGDRTLRDFPQSLQTLAQCEPVYEELEGWHEDISSLTSYDDLPGAARAYLKRVRELTGVDLALVSIGRNRTQTVELVPVFR
ncbi:MAG: adenylosuccinate synthase [Firmicutes bacterium]|nr:adenylosuccinate synthase [Bacillota bacterium]